jgi:Na+-driven multidrug efflux pump
MMLVFAIGCHFWGREMIAFFSPDPDVIDTALAYFKWVAPTYVGLGVGITLGSAIQGAGATRQTFILDLAVILLFQIPACWLVVNVFHGGEERLWQVVGLTYLVSAVVYSVAYRRGVFLRTQLH